jgi:predicted DNA-binding transcriptional regulator YafY
MTSTSATSRLLLLLSLLQTRRDWPGGVLADRLDISHRTVRRDVDRLREMGYSIAAIKGPDGGYRLDAGAELPPLLFDDDQVIALAVAVQAATLTGAGIEEAAVRALTTVRQVMPSRLRHRLDALQFTTLTSRPPPRSSGSPQSPGSPQSSSSSQVDVADDTVAPDLLIALSTAIRAREILRFDYARGDATPAASAAAAATSASAGAGAGAAVSAAAPPHSRELQPPRRVEPHHLVTSSGRWYLVAWDLERDDWRIFRVDRITPRTPTGPRFTPRDIPGGDVHTFVNARFKGSNDTNAWPCRGTVILNLPASAILPFAGDGTVVALAPDRCSYEVGSWSWVGLAASLGRFDTTIEVVGPPELTAAFGELAARYATTAATTTTSEAAAD